MLVIHILLLFALLNPLIIPFALIYFLVERSEYPFQCIVDLASLSGPRVQLSSRTRYGVIFVARLHYTHTGLVVATRIRQELRG